MSEPADPFPSAKAVRIGADPTSAQGHFIFTCEHASNAVPGRTLTEIDRSVLASHWGWDIGAAEVVRHLCAITDSVGVLSQHSRLLVDVNRRLGSDTLILDAPGGTPVSFNQDMSESDRQWRLSIHEAYHAEVDALVDLCLLSRPVHLVSVHSFTPIWNGQPRPMEIGILFDVHHAHAQRVHDRLTLGGHSVALNEPYSGLEGELMYGASRNGQAHNIPYIEFEVRQDLISTPEGAEAMAHVLAESLKAFMPAD